MLTSRGRMQPHNDGIKPLAGSACKRCKPALQAGSASNSASRLCKQTQQAGSVSRLCKQTLQAGSASRLCKQALQAGSASRLYKQALHVGCASNPWYVYCAPLAYICDYNKYSQKVKYENERRGELCVGVTYWIQLNKQRTLWMTHTGCS